ncbi:MAG: GDSL-type esterase/lipase family protein [Saprospiraceae bacterium]
MSKFSLPVLTVNFIVLLLLLLLVEIVLRALGLGFGSSPYEPDRVYHHARPKNYSFTMHDPIYDEFGGYKVYFDSNGYRYKPGLEIPSSSATQKVAFLGDSFVESNQSPWDSTFIGILQRKFPQQAFHNYGIGSYSPSIYYLQLKHFLLSDSRIKPDIVVMVLFSNDVRGDLEYTDTQIRDSNGDLIALDGGSPNLLISMLRKSYLCRWIRKCNLIIWYRLNKAQSIEELLKTDFQEELPVFEGTYTEQMTLQSATMCKEKGVKFILSAIPSKSDQYTGLFSTDSFARRVQNSAGKHGIPFIDLQTPFEEKTKKSHEKLFYPIDIHLNNAGQRVVSEILASYFQSNFNWLSE